jgi:branched-chain amino acid transport system substrate-binding protein
MQLRRRSWLGIGAIFILVSSLAACSSGGGGQGGDSSGPYVIGVNEDLSGVLGFQGTPDLAGVRTYIDYVNAHGGVNGKQIKLIALDNASDPATAASDYTQLQNDHALAVLGFVNSATLVGVEPVAKAVSAADRPVLFSLGGPTNLLYPASELNFSYGLLQQDEADEMVSVLHELAAEKHITNARIAILAANASSTSDFIAQVKSSVSRYAGWKVVDTQLMPIAVTDVTAQALSIAQSKPDFVVMLHNDSGAAVAVPGLRRAGVTVPIVNAHVPPASFTKLDDANYYGVDGYADPLMTNVPAIRIMNSRAKAYGQSKNDVGEYFTSGYVAGLVVQKALEACGKNCTPPQFSRALESLHSLNDGGLSGPAGFSASDHELLKYGLVFRYDTATKQVVAVPPDIKTQVVYPK